MAPTPAEQWWAINGQVLMDSLHRCHDGENPEMMYLELIANSGTIDVEDNDE